MIPTFSSEPCLRIPARGSSLACFILRSRHKARLFSLSSFSHSSYSGLAEIFALALVRVELLLDSGLCFRLPAEGRMCRELHITELAYPKHWNVVCSPDDPKFSLCHGG